MKFNTDELNSDIIEVFKNAGIDGYLRKPLLYPDLLGGEMLFVGCNPSFNEDKVRERIANETNIFESGCTLEELYDINNIDKYFDKHLELSRRSRLNIKGDPSGYFKKLPELADTIGLDWDHIDIYYISETNQGKVKEMCENHPGFFMQQLEISIDLINKLEPQIIVVINAFAASKIKEKVQPKFDENLGTYLYEFNNQKMVPLFLSSMISGQRALDVESFARLKWHIKWAYNKFYNTK